MFDFLKLAFRNVLRNKRRTSISIFSVAAGAAALILFGGYIQYSYWGVQESSIHSGLGHIQIYKKGYWERGGESPLKYSLDDSSVRGIEGILSGNRKVAFSTYRLGVSGLISNGDSTVTFLGNGIVPDKEAELTSFVNVIRGSDLFPKDRYNATLGEGLAKSLHASVGDTLTLLASTEGGSINAIDVNVKGIFRTGFKQYDDIYINLPIQDVQTLLYTGNIQSIIVVLKQTSDTAAVARELDREFKQAGLPLETRTWYELSDLYPKLVKLYSSLFLFLSIIIIIIVILSIINTMVMSVFERVKELGTLRAMGISQREIWWIFIFEGAILGVIGAIVGMLLGSLLAVFISLLGIELPPPPGSTQGYPLRIFVVPEVLLMIFFLSVITTTVAAFYPAFLASRLKIAEALRHV